jgi:hypothetical protein
MKPTRITSEHLLFALAILLGLGLRLINLEQAPLSDYEAKWALQALSVAHGESFTIGSQPGYVLLSGLLFWLFNSNNFLARLLPALAGSALILAPLFFRPRLGRTAALILAFGLALDPGLVSISRLAGGPMLAAGCAVLAAGFAFRRRPIFVGVFAGLALLSGASLWTGLLGIGLTLLFLRWRKQNPENPDSTDSDLKPETSFWQPDLKLGITAAVITIFLIGSLFFRYPQGLGAWLLSITEFLKGWVSPSDVPALRLAASLLFYQPLAVIFGLICVGHVLIFPAQNHLNKPLVYGLFLWLVISLLIPMINIGRSMSDLVWTLLPLWTLASLELAVLVTPDNNRLVALGHAALTFILLCILWLIFSAVTEYNGGIPNNLQIAQLVGDISLLVVAAFLINLGWGWETARPGLAWGSAAFLGLYMLSATWGISQYSAGGKKLIRQELWYPAPLAGNVDLLTSALADLSLWHTNNRNAIDIRLAVDAPSMVWALRDYPNIKTASTQTPVLDLANTPPEELPSIIITYTLDRDLNLSAPYRGQDFSWQVNPAWDGILPPSFLLWLVHRQGPTESYQVILWARADLFPGGLLSSDATDQTSP